MALKFRTEVAVNPVGCKVSHGSHVVTVGSCFSDEIGLRLQRDLFDVAVNPVGTLYNPMSIASSLDAIMSGRVYTEADLVCRDGIWHSFDHHSRFSSAGMEQCLCRINSAMDAAREALRVCTHLFVTFGTAFVYTRDGRVVANCHKFPAAQFERRRVTVDEIVGLWRPLMERLRAFAPGINIVFTVSPIRHLSDGAHGNQLSKATLQLAVDTLIAGTDGYAGYFPAYELVLDDLRDYRFYASDLTHPSDMAVDYIYGKFADMYFTPETMRLATEAGRLTRFAQHRQLTDDPIAAEAHALALHSKIESLLNACPDMAQAVNRYIHSLS